MANKLKIKTPPPPNPEVLHEDKEVEVTIDEVVKDERTTKILGAICLLASLFIFIAIISYVFSWQEDQDVVHQFGVKIFATQDVKVQNMLGVLGAFVAHHLVYNGFGVISIIISSLFFVVGVNLLFGKKIFSVQRNIKYLLVGLIVFSTCFAFITPQNSFSWGGAVGEYLSAFLVKWLGNFGTGSVLACSFFSYIIWRFNPTFKIPKFQKTNKANNSVDKETHNSDSLKEYFTPENDKLEEEIQQLDAIKLGKVELDENGLPIVTNKLKSSTINPLQINIEEQKNVEFEVFEKDIIEEESTTTKIEVEPIEPQTINEKYATASEEFPKKPTVIEAIVNAPIVLETSVQKPTSNLPNLALEINETTQNDDEENIVEEFETEIEETTLEKQSGRLDTLYEPTLDLSNYKYPTIDLLETHGSEKIIHDPNELENNKNQIISTLKNYDIEIQRIAATVGPTVTLYEIVPAPGVRISRIKNLEDDIALSLAALGIRIIAPIPGKGTIGIEVPNIKKTVVSMKTLLQSDKFVNSNFSLPIAIGKKIDNENFIVDLATMPHLLMAGATGQGKSVGINTLLVSLLYKKHPSQLKFVLVDPKKVELSLYRTIEKHFLAKLPGEEESIITDTKKVVYTLNALCIEMDNRYDLLKEAGCRNIREYNEKFVARKLNPQKGHQYLPFIVLVVDEFADLIMTAGKEVEMPIARLAQLARAIGIHLIIATQRPSVNIITGTIKANFPARIAFKVSSKIDSRTILDAGGAEQLIGKGDMLISYNGEITRLQCAFVDTPEVEKVCDAIGDQQGYPQPFYLPEFVDEKEFEKGNLDVNDRDPLFEDAARLIVQNQMGSTSLIQRRMKLGYNRAGRLMDQLEQAGIVGPNVGSKAREVKYKTEAELNEFFEMQ
jgi:DNA segregation ATPase FtsK/SpoIIIE, S-DNA-T family